MRRRNLWERMEAAMRPAGAMATMEEPGTIVRIATSAYLGSALNAILIALLFFLFEELPSAWAAVALSLAYVSSWMVVAVTGSLWSSYVLFAVASAANNVFVHVAMGGYANSGAYLLWGIPVVVGSALVLNRLHTIALAGLYAGAAIVFGFLEQALQAGRPPPDPALPAIMFSYLLVATLALLTSPVMYFLSRLAAERARAERLLLNVLPKSIARRLKRGSGLIADEFSGCTVLFADIHGFTAHSERVSAGRLVEELNLIFSAFDRLADQHGVQKIKTLGDGYMAVAGVPDPRPDHVEAACDLALEMQRAMADLNLRFEDPLELRIGIHTGSAIAGIIGSSRFSYDLWGDTVNTASRMESHGPPGRIQVTEAVYESGRGRYRFQPVGIIDVKDKGPMRTYLLLDPL